MFAVMEEQMVQQDFFYSDVNASERLAPEKIAYKDHTIRKDAESNFVAENADITTNCIGEQYIQILIVCCILSCFKIFVKNNPFVTNLVHRHFINTINIFQKNKLKNRQKLYKKLMKPRTNLET